MMTTAGARRLNAEILKRLPTTDALKPMTVLQSKQELLVLQGSALHGVLNAESQGILKSVLQALQCIERGQKPPLELGKTTDFMKLVFARAAMWCQHPDPDPANPPLLGAAAMVVMMDELLAVDAKDPTRITFKLVEPMKACQWLLEPEQMKKTDLILDALIKRCGSLANDKDDEAPSSKRSKAATETRKRKAECSAAVANIFR